MASLQGLIRTGRLPRPSDVGARALAAARSPRGTVDDLAAILDRDPALTQRILAVASSPLLGDAQPVHTAKGVALRLGLEAVGSLAAGLSALAGSRRSTVEVLDPEAFWARALGTAVAAEGLARLGSSERPTEAFSAGLLLELGRLALACASPVAYAGVLRLWRGDAGQLAALEQDALGLDHTSLGPDLLAHWGLGPELVATCRQALGGAPDADLTPGARLLRVAPEVAELLVGEEDAAARLETLLAPLGVARERLEGLLPTLEDAWRVLAEALELPSPQARVALAEVPLAVDPQEPAAAPRELVLAVDSDPRTLHMLGNCIERAGYRLLTAASAEAALALALQHEPRALVTDWRPDGIDGLALCRTLRQCEVGAGLFVMVLTAIEEQHACAAALEAQADDLIPKPCLPRELTARLTAGLRREQPPRAAREVLDLEGGALLDPVTGLPVRSQATSRLAVLFESALRREQDLALVALAVDGLSPNPLLANEQRRRTAQLLEQALRRGDLLGCSRGGFLLLCPGADLDAALQLAERLRLAVEQAALELGGVPLTVSAGVAERGPGAETPAALLRLAELVLELGTLEGVNQVHPAA